MRNLGKRVEELEHRVGLGRVAKWVRVIVPLGETQERAFAAHEAEHGPTPSDVGVIVRTIVGAENRLAELAASEGPQ
jgi:hypothetical protein